MASIISGQDSSFDLLNYHLYIPYSLLNDRWHIDLIPAGMHTFFNPLLDVPYYLLFSHLMYWPRLTAFIQGMWYGVFVFFAWKVCVILFPGFRCPQAKLLRLSAFLMGVLGYAALCQIGRAMNEVSLAALNMGALYLLICRKPSSTVAPRFWGAAAFVTCAAAGLKYTAAPAAVGLGLAGLWLWWKNRRSWGEMAFCVGCGVVGFLVVNGFFMWRLWDQLGNPFFPYFNAIFHSPYFAAENLANGIGEPHNWAEWIFFPFIRMFSTSIEHRLDPRLAAGWLAVVLLCLHWLLCGRSRGVSYARLLNGYTPVIILFFVGMYVPWMSLFGVMRYSICLEFASSVLVVAALRRYLGSITGAAVAVLLALCLFFIPKEEWHREHFREKNLVLSPVPKIEDNSLVLLAGGVSFFVPFLNPNAQYVGGIWFHPEDYADSYIYKLGYYNRLQPSDYQYYFDDLIRQRIAEAKGKIYILGPSGPLVWDNATWKRYGIYIQDPLKQCQMISSNFDVQYGGFVLCQADKKNEIPLN